MDAAELNRRARTFEQGAEAYDRLRPQFPAEIFETLRRRVGRRWRSRVLEVGAGTGRVTIPLLGAGALVEIAEPSADMVRVLTDRLAVLGLSDHALVRQITFEQIPDENTYDLVLAAQSFHWADPETRWRRLAAMIRPDGRAFMCWNGWSLDGDHHDLEAVRAAYDADGEGVQADLIDGRSNGSWVETEVDAAPGLRTDAIDEFSWGWTLSIEDYLALLATTSQYVVVDRAQRERLFTALHTVLGEEVHLAGRTFAITIAPE
ncbi:hypothetical protein HX89_14445 (plasmid) [Dermacoccus nishinomiyaensis]|uniref:Methyltransferase domain-containing protein n=1 Tax=Dermacoccus nishinomiyaensis TaxID=1274 RepID=A0A075JJD7_9MICO|nr:class I SAM-dependent methyltransferase [Dermacoccus nishinomiyaensis]AIF41900.1 hypothetical protein HX89_14445 [Dermacoccus nishinomiyaensis]